MEFSEEFQFEDEAAREWYERMVHQVQQNAPTCLSGFRTHLIQPSDPEWDERTSWELTCMCGSRIGQILGHSLKDFKKDYNGPLTFVTPLGFHCSSCNQSTEIIDTDQHGYNGECKSRFGDYGAATYHGSGQRDLFTCQKCSNTQFTVSTCFQYSVFDFIEENPEFESVAQDFFDWFECSCICTSCNEEQSIGDYELA